MNDEERVLLLEIGIALGALLESHTTPGGPDMFAIAERYRQVAAPVIMRLTRIPVSSRLVVGFQSSNPDWQPAPDAGSTPAPDAPA